MKITAEESEDGDCIRLEIREPVDDGSLSPARVRLEIEEVQVERDDPGSPLVTFFNDENRIGLLSVNPTDPATLIAMGPGVSGRFEIDKNDDEAIEAFDQVLDHTGTDTTMEQLEMHPETSNNGPSQDELLNAVNQELDLDDVSLGYHPVEGEDRVGRFKITLSREDEKRVEVTIPGAMKHSPGKIARKLEAEYENQS